MKTQTWTLNTTTHRRHQTTSRWQTLSKRCRSHCANRKRTRACTRVRSEPINSESAEETMPESREIHALTVSRESARTSGKTRQRFGSEMCLPDVQPRESIFRVLKSSDTRPPSLPPARFLHSGFALLWIRLPLTKLNGTMRPIKFNYNSRAKNSNATSWVSWIMFAKEQIRFNNLF